MRSFNVREPLLENYLRARFRVYVFYWTTVYWESYFIAEKTRRIAARWSIWGNLTQVAMYRLFLRLSNLVGTINTRSQKANLWTSLRTTSHFRPSGTRVTKSQFCASHIFHPGYRYHRCVRNYTGYDNYENEIGRITHVVIAKLDTNKFYTDCYEASEVGSCYFHVHVIY